MTALHKNRVQMTVTGTPGTGTITLNAASSGYQTFAAAYAANATVDVLITDGTAWEVARNCTYTNSGTTLTRGTLEASSTGTAISLTSAAVVSVILSADKGNSVETLMGAFGLDEIAVTGAVTATIGRMHHCTGTSANYTVTLPAASGNTGKLIGFRMGSAAGLTKLVTIDGNASETIDGQTTRIMWATEAAILLCDGSNWHKVAGKSVPMSVVIKRATDQSFSQGVWTATTFTAKDSGTDFMWDSGNGRVKIERAGNYDAVGKVYVTFGGVTQNTYLACVPNATTPPGSSQQAISTTDIQFAAPMGGVSLAVADYINLSVYCAGTTPVIKGTSNAAFLHVAEVPVW